MKKNIALICISALVLVLVIVLPFCFNNNEIRLDNKIFSLYLVSKIIFGLILIFSVIWCTMKERAKGFVYITLSLAYLLQGVPALCRIAPHIKGFGVGFEVIVLVVGLMIYIGMFALITWSSQKQLVSDEKYIGKEIPVQEEKTILEEKKD